MATAKLDSLVRWLKRKTSRKACFDAIGHESTVRVLAYFEVLERIAPLRKLRRVDVVLRAYLVSQTRAAYVQFAAKLRSRSD